ncbi:MAG TPA: hypothetical protein VK421_20350 [Pyrinomonadaceae bacterium]|nr:hypothetical protein [Pyrinomonadaceae bacterium]
MKRIPIIAVMMAAILPSAAAQVRIDAKKGATAIPKVCESVVPASIGGEVDTAALAKEAVCRGAGDMMAEYTYVLKSSSREKNKQGRVKKEETTTYEVYIPMLRSGARAVGVLIVTNRNGVPVPPEELERERLRAGKRLEAEEAKIARHAGEQAESSPGRTSGMFPLGEYPRIRIKRGLSGVSAADVALVLQTFLETCDLAPAGREQINGRETLVFSFAPRPGTLFDNTEKYIRLLRGTIWIDAKDRIVTKLAGWPSTLQDAKVTGATTSPGETPPAVFIEMTRLPEGVWLPGVVRLNGADYPKLFDGVAGDTTLTYGEYKRFTTETKDAQIEKTGAPL